MAYLRDILFPVHNESTDGGVVLRLGGMSHTIISSIAIILVNALPELGIGAEQLTGTVQSVITVVGAFYIWFRRYQSGDVTFFGAKV